MKREKRLLSAILALVLVFNLALAADTGLYEVLAADETSQESESSDDADADTDEDTDDETITVTASSNDGEDYYESELAVEKVEDLGDDFIMGVDVSSVIVLENAGVTYYDFDGNEEDLFVILADAGVNYIRVRVWNDPYDEDGNAYGGGNNDIEICKEIGLRATAAGLKLYVDFHYSDFWADPSKQRVPKAWETYSSSEIAEAITEFTTESLETLYDAGIDIGMVQVGNETTSMFVGASYGTTAYYSYFVAGCDAVRDFSDTYDLDIKVAVHWTNPNNKNYTSVVKNLLSNGVDFDIFASSYYPAWHGTLENAISQLESVKNTYGVDVMIAETAYPYQNETDTSTYTYGISVQAQATYMQDLIESVNEIGGLGVFYWEPAWLSTKTSDINKYGVGWASSYAADYDTDVAEYGAGACTTTDLALFYKESTYNFYPLESLNVFKYVYKGTTAAYVITDVESASVEISIGDDVELPSEVTVTYGSGSTGSEPVEWDADEVSQIDTSKEGEYTITGTVDGYDGTVYCEVSVYDIYIVCADDVSVTVEKGGTIEYPDTVTITKSNAQSAQAQVSWDADAVAQVSSDTIGEYVVSGTVDGYEGTVYCTVTVYAVGDDIVTNGDFEDVGSESSSSGNYRSNITGWTFVSSSGTSSDWPIYVENKNGVNGSYKLSLWSSTYGGYTAEAYQEIDISQYGPGVYTVSVYATGDAGDDSVYIYLKDGDYDSEIAGQSYVAQNDGGSYVQTTFTVTITGSETVTVGIVGENIAKNEWVNIDNITVTAPAQAETTDLEELETLVSSYSDYISDGTLEASDALAAAIEAAQEVLSDDDATDDEIAVALSELEEAASECEFAVIVNESSNGSASADIASAKPGETVTITADADDTYELYSLKVLDGTLAQVDVDDDGTFTMPSSPVTVTAVFKKQDKYYSRTMLYYYYSGDGTPAILFEEEIADADYDFTYDGLYGYYMSEDAATGECWYKFKVKESYGSFSIYIADGSSYELAASFEEGGDDYDEFFDLETAYIFRGVTYDSLSSVEGLDRLDSPEISASSSTDSRTFTLKWDAVYGAETYLIYEDGELIDEVSGTTYNREVDKSDKNVSYTYYVIASDDDGEKKNSSASNSVTLTALAWPVTTATRNGSKVTVAWEEIDGADGYLVQRSTDGSTYTTIKTITSASTVSYSDSSQTVSKSYYYRVVPYYLEGSAKIWGCSNSKYVSGVSVSKPTSVTVKRTSPTKIKITWKKVSGATGYIVYRSTKKSSGYKAVKTVTSNTKSSFSYTNTGTKAGTTYYYRVVAYKTVGSGKIYSSYTTKTLSKVTVTSLKTSKVTLKSTSSKKVKITWKKVSNCTGYIIYRSTKKGSGYKKIKTITSKSKVSYTDTGLKKGKTYYYKIKTYKTVGTGKIYGKLTTAKKVKVK